MSSTKLGQRGHNLGHNDLLVDFGISSNISVLIIATDFKFGAHIACVCILDLRIAMNNS